MLRIKGKSIGATLLCAVGKLSAAAALATITISAAAAAQPLQYTETMLHSFQDGTVPNDGIGPWCTLTQGTDGNFYGVSPGTAGLGTFFRMTPSGQVTILHHFMDGSVPNDGEAPNSQLVQGKNGNFYGTTTNWGSSGNPGTVFEMTPTGQETVLHNFQDGSVPNDGFNPNAVTLGSDGNIYGTTFNGGSAGQGTVFMITPSGQETILHNFGDGSVPNDGDAPWATVIQGQDGNLYGTTSSGGVAGYGTIFRMTLSGKETILHSFQDGTVYNDGLYPQTPLVQAPNGNLYGTTTQGETQQAGTFFVITLAGQETVLHSFCDGTVPNDGRDPWSTIVLGADGNFYGATGGGGGGSINGYTDNGGTVYQMTPYGQETILHAFSTGSVFDDSGGPNGIMQGKDGNLYGTCRDGGITDSGTIFTITNLAKAPKITSLQLAATTATGGNSTTATVTFANGTVTPFTPLVYGTPAGAISAYGPVIPSGATSATFTITAGNLASVTSAKVYASSGGATQSAALKIYPLSIGSLSFSPNQVYSGYTTQGTVTLAVAPLEDETVNITTSDANASVSGPVIVPAGQTSATFIVTAASGVFSTDKVTFTATAGASTKTAKLAVVSATTPIASFSFSPNYVLGGSTTTGVVRLKSAPPVNERVHFTFPSDGSVGKDGAVYVLAGQTTATFVVYTSPVTALGSVVVSATAGGPTVNGTLVVEPPVVPLYSVSFATNHIFGGAGGSGIVKLAAPATADETITITTSDANASPLGSVVVPAGQTSTTFSVTTLGVAAADIVTVTGSAGGSSASGLLYLEPYHAPSSLTLSPNTVVGGGSVTGTLKLKYSADLAEPMTVSISDANATIVGGNSIVVPKGQSSMTFTIDTSAVNVTDVLTITVTSASGTVVATLTINP